MEACHIHASLMRPHIFGLDLVERQGGGVDKAGLRAAPVEHLAGHYGAGIEADRAAGEQVPTAHGDEIGGTGTRADEMHGHGLLQRHWVIGIEGRHPIMPPKGAAWATERRTNSPPRSA